MHACMLHRLVAVQWLVTTKHVGSWHLHGLFTLMFIKITVFFRIKSALPSMSFVSSVWRNG